MTADRRPLCVLCLSCLGAGIKYLLQSSDEFVQRYRLACHFSHQMNRVAETVNIPKDQLDECEVFIYHNTDWVTFTEAELDAYEQLLDRVSPAAHKIAVPLAQLHAFWPFHTNDPRYTSDRRANRFDQLPDYPYGDAYVIELLKDGVPEEEIITRYLALDFGSRVDLDKLLSWSLTFMQRNERHSPVKVADYVAERFRSEKLFSTVNHANNRLLLYMTNQVLSELECAPLPEALLERLQVLVGTEMPVHPGIARHFDVQWANEATRYLVDRSRYLTFGEFLRDYVYFV